MHHDDAVRGEKWKSRFASVRWHIERFLQRALLLAAFLSTAVAPVRAGGLEWRNVGPALSGGRVAAVAGTDRNPRLYYLGAAGGGVFRTTDGGLNWTDVWTRASVGAIGAIAIAPSDPNVVWVGTGESTPRNDASYGDGVWMTRDGGAHWVWRGLPDTYAIAKIVIDPNDPNRVLVGALGNPFLDSAARGVYRTTDGGKTWRHTLSVGPQSGISDLALDERHPEVVYAGVWQFRRTPWTFTSGGPLDGIYKSTDGGATWRALRGHGLPAAPMGRIGLAVAPSDSRRLYALIQSHAGLLWRSDDGGAHWRLRSRDTLIDQRPFYMSRLAVDPTNRDHVFFSSENLIETFDGGTTFEDISSAVHQDHHGMWIAHDGRRMIEANDGGAPISVDGGKHWDWRFAIVLSQIYHVGYDDANPYRVCAAMQDDDSYCGPSNSLSQLGITDRDWRDVANDADGTWVWPEPGNPNAVWNVGVNELNGQLGIFDLNSRQDVDISPDVTDTNGRGLAGLPHRFNWEAPVAFSRAQPGVAYFGGNVLFETRDRGRTWQTISPDLTRNDPAKQQVAGGPINTDVSGAEFYDTLLDIAPSPLDGNVLWTGSDDGVISRTSDGGAHWQNVTPQNLAPWGRVDTVEASRASALRAYAAVDRHLLGDRRPYIYTTDDGGRTWRLIVGGLPAFEFAHVVREDPQNPDVLYAGLEQGVWLSLDRGAHWETLRHNMPAVSIHDLRIEPQSHDLIAGSHGRGIWILDDLTPLAHLSDAQTAGAPVLFAVRPAYVWYLWWEGLYGVHDTECCVPDGTFSGEDPPYGALISYYLPQSLTGVRVDIVDAQGQVVRRLSPASNAGVNRFAWDLAEQPPVPWDRARDWNRGPDDGPPVVPGNYSVRLRVAGQTLSQPISVLADPRAAWTQADYVARNQFLRELDDELSGVDQALNHLDDLRARTAPAMQRKIAHVYGQFTSGVVNSEDNQWMPDRLRERLTNLQGVVALSQGPPLPPHLREAAAIRTQYREAMEAYHAFLAASGLENAP
ncbi:MAG: hypothetical protein JOZ38_07795 [Candidatus Eremiobacteraeota bacterium]|nr:hypothetical protein [Candidatus Eremiobacteraeota bacterium]